MNRLLTSISKTHLLRLLCNRQCGIRRVYSDNFVFCGTFLTSKISSSVSESPSSALSFSSVNSSHCLQHPELSELKIKAGDSSTKVNVTSSLSPTLFGSHVPHRDPRDPGSLRTCYILRIISSPLLTKDLCSSSNINARPLHSLAHSRLLSCALRLTPRTSKRTKYNSSADDDESDDEYEDLSDDEHFFKEDADLPNNYRDITVHVKSLRLDAILAHGLNVARNKVDEHFLGSNLELNGDRVLKKGKKLSVGDYIDVITTNDGDTRKFKRVRITNVSSKTTKSDRKTVHMRVWRANVSMKEE